VVHLKQSILRTAAKAANSESAVQKSWDLLNTAAKDFKSSISEAVTFIALKKYQADKDEALIKQISEGVDMDFKKTQIDVRKKRLEGTGTWILNDPKFKEWLKGDLKILWCPGTGNAFAHITLRLDC
jgi:uncharacterized protein (DUF779 family)